MGTQQTTNSNSNTGLNFNQTGLNAYNSLVGSGSNVLNQYMNNPFGNPMYQFGQAQTQAGAKQLGQQNMNTLMQNQKVSGLSGNAGAGWLGAQKAQTGRANQAMASQGNISNIMNALQRQMTATGMGMSFSPLATGQSSSGTQTSSTQGLGTWLPQLLGAGLGAASMFGTGGASTAAGPSASAVSSLPAAAMWPSNFTGFNTPSSLAPSASGPMAGAMMQQFLTPSYGNPGTAPAA